VLPRIGRTLGGEGGGVAHLYAERGPSLCSWRAECRLKWCDPNARLVRPLRFGAQHLRRHHTRRRLDHHKGINSVVRFPVNDIHSLICIYRVARSRHAHRRGWRLCLCFPVLEIAGVRVHLWRQPDIEGIRLSEAFALAAIKGNYLGPLLSY